jgi:hypothetical protein
VTLKRRTSTQTASTGATTVSDSTVAGAAMRVRGNPTIYKDLGLVESAAPTLLWSAETYGDRAQLGDELTWAGATVRVKSIDETDPDGAGPIVSRLVVAR